MNLQMRVICRGNARRFGLRVIGKRNALWMPLNRRTCMWQSGTTASLAIAFRCNTHTAPNYRLPPLQGLHDDENCKRDCMHIADDELKRVCKLAQRAQREATGYFCGYTCKRQPVGRYELKEIAKMLNLVRMGLDEKKAGAQMHRARKQMVADLHHRSMIRPATEEFNLAANHDPHDVSSAEHVRTYMNKEYIGNKLAQRLEAEKNSGERKGKHLVAPLVDTSDVREIHVRHFDDQYGFRGRDHRVYYLNPWEFLM